MHALCDLVVPYHMHFDVEDLTICEKLWLGEETQRLMYAYGTLLLTYILLLTALYASYVKLRASIVPGKGTHKHKIHALVAAFGACWLPIHVFNVLHNVDIQLIDKRHFLLNQLLCLICAMSMCCCNQ